jgi:ketosteroid isomerase-like protein
MRWALIVVLMLVPAVTDVAQSRGDDVELVIEAFLVPFSNRDIPAFIEIFAEDATIFLPQTATGAPTGRTQAGKTSLENSRRCIRGWAPPPEDVVRRFGRWT